MGLQETLRRARGLRVTVDAAALIEFVDASRSLHDFINRELLRSESRPADTRMERWEMANVTLTETIES